MLRQLLFVITITGGAAAGEAGEAGARVGGGTLFQKNVAAIDQRALLSRWGRAANAEECASIEQLAAIYASCTDKSGAEIGCAQVMDGKAYGFYLEVGDEDSDDSSLPILPITITFKLPKNARVTNITIASDWYGTIPPAFR